MERNLVASEGEDITHLNADPHGKTLEQCQHTCDQTDGCKSITWGPSGKCFLKKKCVTEQENSNIDENFMTYYKPCVGSGICILIQTIYWPCFYGY